DKFPPGLTQSPVTGRRRSAISLPEVDDSLPIACDYCRRVVSRAVVDDDDFQRLIGLLEDALQGFPQVAFAVEDRDDATDQIRLSHRIHSFYTLKRKLIRLMILHFPGVAELRGLLRPHSGDGDDQGMPL